MRRATLVAGAALALFAGSPGFGQQAQQTPDAEPGNDIVVTGRAGEPVTGSEVSRQAREVTAHPTAMHYNALARFEGDRLCPGVVGLSVQDAGLMIDRIRGTASELGVQMTEDDGTCRPNFVVAFVDDGQATIRAIERGRYWLFKDMPYDQVRELLREEGPVRVWTATIKRTRDGMPLGSTQWMAHSRIYLATREDIVWVLVLIDRDDARGKTLLQLADYSTMRGLARTRPVESDGQPMDTILALFDSDAEPPSALTEFDRAYLASLYDGLPNMPGITKVLGVNRQLRLQANEEQAASAEGE